MYLAGDYRDIEGIYPSFDITNAEYITRCIELKTTNEVRKY
jgi:methylthioribose-1-phosphate isomerase